MANPEFKEKLANVPKEVHAAYAKAFREDNARLVSPNPSTLTELSDEAVAQMADDVADMTSLLLGC